MPSESIRLTVINAIKQACRDMRGGAYHVRRGRVNWSKFPFDRYPLAISVMVPEEDLTTEPVRATVTLELMTKMPDHSALEIDDEILDQMREDCHILMRTLTELTVTNASGGLDNLFLGVQMLPSLEIADSEQELQGIEQPFIVEY